jgi:hypothetical protein
MKAEEAGPGDTEIDRACVPWCNSRRMELYKITIRLIHKYTARPRQAIMCVTIGSLDEHVKKSLTRRKENQLVAVLDAMCVTPCSCKSRAQHHNREE